MILVIYQAELFNVAQFVFLWIMRIQEDGCLFTLIDT